MGVRWKLSECIEDIMETSEIESIALENELKAGCQLKMNVCIVDVDEDVDGGEGYDGLLPRVFYIIGAHFLSPEFSHSLDISLLRF